MNSPFGGVPGAVVDDGVLQHLGAPLPEQRMLAEGRAIAPRGDRAVIVVEGEKRLGWLDSFASQRLTGLPAGESRELLVLDPQGRVRHAASVIDDGTSTWLLTERTDAAALVAFLTAMRFRSGVTARDVSAGYGVVGGTPDALTAVRPVVSHGAALVWHDPWPGVVDGGWAYARPDEHPGAERDWAEAVVSRAEQERLADAAAFGRVQLAGALAVEALRIAAWRPRLTDADEVLLPHEMDWMRTAVHLHKGCYRGQETVAKVHNLGHPPRRLVFLQLDGSESILPAHGDGVFDGEKQVGVVTAAALHYEDGPVALALVSRRTPVDVALVVRTDQGDVAAAAEVVVPPDAGRVAPTPRLPRRGQRRPGR